MPSRSSHAVISPPRVAVESVAASGVAVRVSASLGVKGASSSAHEAKVRGRVRRHHRADTRRAAFRTMTGAEGRSVWASNASEGSEITPPRFVNICYCDKILFHGCKMLLLFMILQI